MMHHLHIAAAFSCATMWIAVEATAQKDRPDPARLVRLLNDKIESQRDKAADELRAIGKAAVRPLVEALSRKEDAKFERRVLRVLAELGPPGGAVVPDLILAIETVDTANLIDLVRTIGDLAPYREEGVVVSELPMKVYLRNARDGRPFWASTELNIADRRVRSRAAFPLRPSIDVLLAALEGYRPYRVELAIELLSRRSTAARSSIPSLSKILDRADPRFPRTKQTLPLRATAARAILKIAPESVAATRARAVIAGQPPAPPREIPNRAKVRIAELIVDLNSTDKVRNDNASRALTAYGRVAVPALAQALPTFSSTESRAAALRVIRHLGRDGGMAASALIEVITDYPAEHTAEILETLAEVAPWSRDVMTPISYSYRRDNLTMFGARINGDANIHVFNKIVQANWRYSTTSSIDPSCTLVELETLLEDRNARMRARALRLLCARGPAARDTLPAVLRAMRESHPTFYISELLESGGSSTRPVSKDDEIHRVAAEAVLAIAPRDGKAITQARAVLERLDARK